MTNPAVRSINSTSYVLGGLLNAAAALCVLGIVFSVRISLPLLLRALIV